VSGHGSHAFPVRQLTIVSIIAAAMAYIESVALIYLRNLLPIAGSAAVNSPSAGNIRIATPFVTLMKSSALLTVLPNSKLAHLELWREVAVLAVVIAVAWISGKNMKLRLAYILYILGVWEIAHYVFLRLFSGWPTTPSTKDLMFLIPGPSVAPVYVPILVAAGMIFAGFMILKTDDS
jgi:hypothetical protein